MEYLQQGSAKYFPSVTVHLKISWRTKLNGRFKLKSTTNRIIKCNKFNDPWSILYLLLQRQLLTCHHHLQANDSVMAPFIHLASLSSMQCWSHQVLRPLVDASNTWLQVDDWRASELQSCLWLRWIYSGVKIFYIELWAIRTANITYALWILIKYIKNEHSFFWWLSMSC